jgi:hypothetical protein
MHMLIKYTIRAERGISTTGAVENLSDAVEA